MEAVKFRAAKYGNYRLGTRIIGSVALGSEFNTLVLSLDSWGDKANTRAPRIDLRRPLVTVGLN